LRNVKSKKYSIFRADILFSIKKYNSVFFVEEGGWHFTNLKTSKEIYYKFSNYLHHREFEHSNLSIKDINNMMKRKISIYNHEVEKSHSKFDGKIKLSKLSQKNLPNFLLKNLNLYKKWVVS
jgi:beta-1,4-mannosyl-glycoprotein beta-1,4-N-acetylglucosaminyltransferase